MVSPRSPEPDPASPTETSPLLSKSPTTQPTEADEAGIPSIKPTDREQGEGQEGQEEEDEVEQVDEPTTAALLLIMSGPWLGSFLAAIDSTIIATLSAPISTSFHSLSLLSWLASAYFIAQAALQPPLQAGSQISSADAQACSSAMLRSRLGMSFAQRQGK
ncbi:hypothetical protein ABVK25_012277 [Lepraria finkii]|uniref:Uncharacterized protein n=1 Tax=Lepraria finkii TaxID=1340010 RepID=A0ABR4AHS6_9LECA